MQSYFEAKRTLRKIARQVRNLSLVELENLLESEASGLDSRKIARHALNVIYSRNDCKSLGINYCSPTHQDYLCSLVFSIRCLKSGLEILPV